MIFKQYTVIKKATVVIQRNENINNNGRKMMDYGNKMEMNFTIFIENCIFLM